ncbi:MAG: SDR family NAD(P)-dependent oxidoreductase [Acidimicrobiales bacterium]|nr:SDR family NAD(P)-dependent oxidoreductase [Acidimicrobiales bacterium]
MELRGKRVLVTGASRGIGAALARRFAVEGAQLALVARSAPALEALADELGGDAYVADLANAEERRSVWDRIITDGPVDVLVNNAAIDAPSPIVGSDGNTNDRILALNLNAPIDLCRLALPGMLASDGGHIVNMSSMASVAPMPGYSVYSASKAGLSHFTAGLRSDLRGRPIDTTLVEVGPVSTSDMSDNMRGLPSSGRALRRLEQLQLIIDVDVPTVVDATVEAVIRGRRHVRLPRRAAAFSTAVELPRRFVELALTGVRV